MEPQRSLYTKTAPLPESHHPAFTLVTIAAGGPMQVEVRVAHTAGSTVQA